MVRYKITLWGKIIIFILAGLFFVLTVYFILPDVPTMRGYEKISLRDQVFDVYFEKESAEIPQKQYAVLQKAISDTKANATMFLYITGNSSAQKKGDYYYKNGDHMLAQQRAQAVADYCILNGIPGFQIFIMENGSLNANGKKGDRVELYLK